MRAGRVSGAYGEANAIVAVLTKWVVAQSKRQSFLQYKRSDMLRLLRLKTWSLRYKLSIPAILDIIVPVLRGQIKSKKRFGGMGVSVRTLVGDGAERILNEEIKKLYPDGGHISIWKESERHRQLAVELQESLEGATARRDKVGNVLDSRSTVDYVQRYRQVVEGRKLSYKQAMLDSVRKKAYRWNPWV